MKSMTSQSSRILPAEPSPGDNRFACAGYSAIGRAAHIMLWMALVLAMCGSAQNRDKPLEPTQIEQNITNMKTTFDETNPVQVEKQLRLINAERQKSMISDASKLLKLAAELNAEVAAAQHTGSFTREQLKKIGQIEKLARSVKEKMSFCVQDTRTMLLNPLPAWNR
jgi:hypothetical protein